MMIAAGLQVGICGDPQCRCVHIDMVDHDEELLCCAAVPLEFINGVIKNLQAAAYEIATTKTEK